MSSLMTDAYAAGLIDGEGCIGIVMNKGYPQVRVDVGMTSKAMPVLEALRERYGGAVHLSREETERWDSAWCWSVTCAKAAAVLRLIQPHLRLKAEQAFIALKAEEIGDSLEKMPNGSRRWTPQARARCIVLKGRMHELNRKGPPLRMTPGTEHLSRIARFAAGVLVTSKPDPSSDLGWETFTGPWPASGMWDATGFTQLPAGQEPRIFASAGSASPGTPTHDPVPPTPPGSALLPTPQARDSTGPKSPETIAAAKIRQKEARPHKSAPGFSNLNDTVITLAAGS